MSDAAFVSRHLQAHEDLDSFRSGQPELDEWPKTSAHHEYQPISGTRRLVRKINDLVVDVGGR